MLMPRELTPTQAHARRRRTLARRVWTLRLVTVAAVASVLGLPVTDVAASARSRSVPELAATRGGVADLVVRGSCLAALEASPVARAR